MNKFTENLIKYFETNYPDIVKQMKTTYHGYLDKNTNKWILNKHHMENSLWAHTMMVVENASDSNNKNVIIAALFHDLGKIETHKDVFDNNNFYLKTTFYGHSGMSVYKVIDILTYMSKDYKLSKDDIIEILNLISNHDFYYNATTLNTLNQYGKKYIDSIKDIALSDIMGKKEENNSSDLDILLKLNNLNKEHTIETHMRTNIDDSKIIEFLIGIPYAGKSTYIKSIKDNPVVISRDDIIMEIGGTDYNTSWKNVDQKLVDKELLNRYNNAVKDSTVKHIVIDMTNLSKKSRKKFITNNYKKIATVFYIGESELKKRINKRTDKRIPDEVLKNFITSYTLPLYDEFDVVKFILN